jgi:hypothetical protein
MRTQAKTKKMQSEIADESSSSQVGVPQNRINGETAKQNNLSKTQTLTWVVATIL